jgi:hypothetical protein
MIHPADCYAICAPDWSHDGTPDGRGEYLIIATCTRHGISACWDLALQQAEWWAASNRHLAGAIEATPVLAVLRDDAMHRDAKTWRRYPADKSRQARIGWLRRHGWRVVRAQVRYVAEAHERIDTAGKNPAPDY